MSKINEKELQELFYDLKMNNQSSFETLYSKYKNLVYGIAYTILKNGDEAEDVAQTVFTKLFQIDKSKLPNSNVSSWLYTVTKNTSLLVLRKKTNDLNLSDIYEIEDTNNEIDNLIDIDAYNKLIHKLDYREKEIVSLKILGNFSFKEIGKLLEEPTSTIKWRYYKAIHSLRLLLSNLGMFIVTFLVGTGILLKKGNKNNNEEQAEDIVQESQDTNRTTDNSSFQMHDTKLENEKTDTNYDVQLNNTETTQYVGVKEYLGIGTIGVSSIFFVITLVFLIINLKYKIRSKRR